MAVELPVSLADDTPRRTEQSLLMVPAIFAATSLAISATFDGETGPTLCVVRLCTGGYCPGCGGSRALVALARGDMAASWAAHPYALMLVAQLVTVALLWVIGMRSRLQRLLVPLLVVNVLLVFTIWAVRMGAGTIPVPFG